MATSRYYDRELPETTAQPVTGLRRSKSRLPISTVAPEEVSSKPRPRVRSRIPNPQQPPNVDSQTSRKDSMHLPDPEPSKSILKTRHTRSTAGLPVFATTTNDSYIQNQDRRTTPLSLRTPSLVSGSTLSTSDSQLAPLRRKPVGGHSARAKTNSDHMQEPQRAVSPAQKACDDDPFPGAIFGISLPPTTTRVARNGSQEAGTDNPRHQVSVNVPGEENRHHGYQSASVVHDSSAASSSRASESPFSLLSTPTSASSYSPVVAQTSQWGVSAGSKNAVDTRIKRPHTLQTGSNAQTPIIPPELAHLNVDLPTSTRLRLPPRRPSRDGTADLTDQQGHSSVVHSNLPATYTPTHKRTPSLEAPISIKSPAESSKGFFGFSSRSSSRHATPRIDSAVPSSPPVRLSLDKSISDEQTTDLKRQDSPMVGSPSSPVKSSRFGFLSKHPKEMVDSREMRERTRKRGPAAGTGHEGYGRLGLRGRSSSIFRGGNFGRSASADSTSSTKSSGFFGRKSNVSSDDERQLDRSPRHQTTPVPPRAEESETKPPSRAEKSTPENGSKAAVVSSSVLPVAKAVKERSSAKSQSRNATANPETFRRASAVGLSSPATYSVKIQAGSPLLEEGREGRWLHSNKQKPRKKSTSPSNFAHRLLAKATQGQEAQEDDTKNDAPAPRFPTRDLAHYALSNTNPSASLDEVQKLADLEVDMSSNHAETTVHKPELAAPRVPYEKRHEFLLPSPSMSSKKTARRGLAAPLELKIQHSNSDSPRLFKAQTATPAKSPQLVDIPKSPATLRPHEGVKPRLSSIGRIPLVVSSKDRDRKLPDRSFSRPFAGSQPRPSRNASEIAEAGRVDDSTKESNDNDKGVSRASQVVSGTEQSTDGSAYFVSRKRSNSEILARDRFIEFPSRHNSGLSYTSSSGKDSPSASGRLGWFADDSWSEYNGLCEENMPSVSTRASSPDTDMITGGIGKPSVNSIRDTPTQSRESVRDAAARRPPKDGDRRDTLHLSSHTAHSVATPSTAAFTISDYLTPGDRTSKLSTLGRSSVPSLNPETKPGPSRRDSLARQVSVSLSRAGNRGAEVLRDELQNVQSSSATSDTPAGPTPIRGEFRHAALVTSKWLSFGKVLFSPIHEEAKSGKEARVLVLDGLGKGMCKMNVRFNIHANNF